LLAWSICPPPPPHTPPSDEGAGVGETLGGCGGFVADEGNDGEDDDDEDNDGDDNDGDGDLGDGDLGDGVDDDDEVDTFETSGDVALTRISQAGVAEALTPAPLVTFED